MNLQTSPPSPNSDPSLPKMEELSQDSQTNHHNDLHCSESTSLLHILSGKLSLNSSPTQHSIINQLSTLFEIPLQNQPLSSFHQKLALSLHQIFHLKFKYLFNYHRNNYHKFLISKPVLQLTYPSKILLLSVFRQYDALLNKKYQNQPHFLQQPLLLKNSLWKQAETLTDPIQIRQYQIKMFTLYKGQFLDILKEIQTQKTDSKQTFKRLSDHLDKDSTQKSSECQCQCRKKKIKTNHLISFETQSAISKQRIQVNVCN